MTLLRASLAVILAGLLLSTPILTFAQKDSRTKDAARHASDAAKTFTEIMNVKEKAIPKELLDTAEAIAVFPDVTKAAFLVGGRLGQGGSYFGKDAAEFLNGISMAVDGGLLSPVTSQSATTRHHPQEPAKPSHSKRDPCPPVPEGPSGASIDDNIRTAVNSFKDALEPKWYAGPDSGEDPLGKLAGHVLWFFNQVKDKGPWDYKYRDPAVNEGKRSKYEPFGNFNYGASGAAAGFSDGQLLRLAGHYQTDRTYARGENPGRLRSILGVGGRAPYGDEPGDQDQIRNGINYYRRKFVLKDCL